MNSIRKSNLRYIHDNLIEERYSTVDQDYLEYEVTMISDEDLDRIQTLLIAKNNGSLNQTINNEYNSILLYITGLSDDFDFQKARSDMIGGAPPDIDIDHDALDREEAIQWCIDYWGREKVANIITHGTFKPKSLARSYYRITEENQDDLNELLKKIPPPKYGKEATLEEILELNPEISDEERYSAFLEFADRIEGMIANFGIHAAGIIISDNDICETVPVWKNSKADRITQYDKDECEELGLIKFDFLGIDTLSIIKEASKLIEQNHNVKINPYAIPDGDEETYNNLAEAKLTGVFQMETSGTAKKLILDIKPQSIEDLSAISALNRPGPLQAGLDKQYITNKLNNSPPEDLPDNVAEILKASYWTLIYQEQILALFTELANFTSKEADDVRRAMGKKKLEVLEIYKDKFVKGCQEHGGLLQDYSESLWSDILGFADYCLDGDTEVLIAGPTKKIKIKDLVQKQEKQIVLSYNIEDSIQKKHPDWSAQLISQWHSKGKKPVFKYTLEDGSFVICTENHKFLSKKHKMLEIDTAYKQKIELFNPKD